MQLLASLRHPPFAFLWSGQTVSRLGDHLYRIALAWWVLEKTGSATAMGTVLVFSSVPQIVFLIVGGVAVDRFSRTHVMLASDLLRGAVVGVVALLAFNGQLEIWHIYAASILFGFVSAFFQPAYTAMVPDITPREVLPSANSLTSLSAQVVGVVGPAMGAAVVAASGTAAAFALDGLTFFVSALFLLPLRALAVAPMRQRAGLLGEVREGVTAVLRSPWLWITIALASVANVTQGGVLAVGLPFLVDQHLRADVAALGWLYSMQSVGSVLGALWLGRLAHIPRRGPTAYLAWLVGGLTVFGMGLPIGLGGALLLALVGGLAMSFFSLIWINTLQEMVPRELLGRVAAIDMLGSFVLLPIGYGVAGWMVDLIGPANVFLLGGGLTAALLMLGLAHPAIRHLD